ncbi:SMI1/KNR4 family protein [Dictyobacter aurantiacus]|nr:SMI1/KNR4 family protein [Dictyobacter aurantiacus]
MYIPDQLQSNLEDGGTMFWYDRDGKQYPINRRTDTDKIPTVWAFEYAPITEERLQIVEQNLGFSLPPLLHAIYSRLANGGFGPGYGLSSLTNTSLSSKRQARFVDFSVFERQTPEAKHIMIPGYVWPNNFFCLCHWGCAIYSYLDIQTGRVFREAYYGDNQYGFECEALSLEAWFELWLAKGIHMFDL